MWKNGNFIVLDLKNENLYNIFQIDWFIYVLVYNLRIIHINHIILMYK